MLEAVSGVALVVVITVVAVLAATGNLFGFAPVLIAVQLAAAGLAVWARRSFPRDSFRVVAKPEGGTLLRVGPYRYVRHPMYTAALLFLWSGIVAHVSVWTVALGALVTGVTVARIVVEERLLRERYQEYAEYALGTKAVIPFVA